MALRTPRSLEPKHQISSQYLVVSFLEVLLPIFPLHRNPHTSHFLEPAWTAIFLLPHWEHRSFLVIYFICQSYFGGEKAKLGYHLLFCFFPPRAPRLMTLSSVTASAIDRFSAGILVSTHVLSPQLSIVYSAFFKINLR